MKRLIINSDDYGRSPDISRGIREAHLRGVVTSSTCMMNIPGTTQDIAIELQETPNLGLGVHLVLTMGRPLSASESVPSLVDENGDFFKLQQLLARLTSLQVEDVKKEWRAQIESFVQAAGRKPTHLDSHHHSSYFRPDLFRAMLELAQEFDCAIRYPFSEPWQEMKQVSKFAPGIMQEFDLRKPDIFISNFYDETATREHMLEIINNMKDGNNELMCHPGHVDQVFAERESIYNFQREREFDILTDPSIRKAIEDNNIQLINFAHL